MVLKSSNKGGELIPPIPAGSKPAVCYSLVDLGHQWGEFEGKGKWTDQVYIGFEIPMHRIEIEVDGQKKNMPRVLSRIFTNSLHPKSNLGPMLISWRGKEFTEAEEKEFDLTKIVGIPCILSVIIKEGGKHNKITGISKAIDGMPVLTPEAPTVMYSMNEDGTANQVIPDGIPGWVVKIIKKSHEWTKGPFSESDDRRDSQPDYQSQDTSPTELPVATGPPTGSDDIPF